MKISQPRILGRSLAILAASMVTLSAYATVYVWDGAGKNTGSANWNTAANWNPDGAPPAASATNEIVFAGTFHTAPNMQGAYTVHSLSFNNTASAFTLGGANTLTLGDGGITNLSGNSQIINITGITLAADQAWRNQAGGTLTISSAVNLQSYGLTFDTASSLIAVSGIISGNGSVTKIGGAQLTLAGVNTYSGATIISNGMLNANGLNNLSNSAQVAVWGGFSTLNLGNDQYLKDLVGNGNVNLNARVLTVAAGNFTGVISGSPGTLIKEGVGTFALGGTADNTYSGGTYVNGGTLEAAKVNAFGSGHLTIASTGIVDIKTFNQSVGAVTNAGTISGTTGTLFANSYRGTGGTLNAPLGGSATVTIASGTNRFTAANTYSGGTTINGGKLVAANTTGSATGSGAVIVNSGGTLGGNGIIAGSVTLNSGAKIAPGASAGTLTTGNQIWNGGATYEFEIDSATGTAGSAWDLLNIIGGLTVNANAGNKFNVDVQSAAPTGFDNTKSYSWLIAQTTTGVSGFDSAAFNVTGDFNGALGGGAFAIDLMTANQVVLTFTPVPEPSTIALGFLAAGAFAVGIRRRGRK